MASSDHLEAALCQGLQALSVPHTKEQVFLLLQYVDLLIKWNHTYNLTAIRRPFDIITKHILDSLSILPYLHGDKILDVGTGAGLPGIPLAIVAPQKHFTLVDSKAKKIRFIQQVLIELGLKHVNAQNIRIESFTTKRYFSTITTRAFAPLSDMLVIEADLLEECGVLLAMKGDLLEEEQKSPPKGYAIHDIQKLTVPGMDAVRNVVILKPNPSVIN